MARSESIGSDKVGKKSKGLFSRMKMSEAKEKVNAKSEGKGYCVKCKKSRDIENGKEVTWRNGMKALKGTCNECGTGIFRIIGKK